MEGEIPRHNSEEIFNDNHNLSQDATNIIQLETLKSNFEDNNNERKSANNLENSKIEIIKESESSSNLNNLSTLFKSYVNRYSKVNSFKDYMQTRRRTILPISNILKSESIKEKGKIIIEEENNNLNLFNIIKERISDVKRDLLQYLEETKNRLETKYNNYINNLNKLLIIKEKKLSKLLEDNDGGDNFINYANDNLFRQIDDILEIHDYIFSALEDHFNLLYSFLDQSNLINQKKPIEYFIDNNSSDILNCWLLNKIDFNQINLSKIISNKELTDLFTGYFSKLNNNEYSSISLQKNDEHNFPLEIELLNKNINKVRKMKFIGLNNNDIIKINEEVYKNIKSKKSVKENRGDAKKVRSLSIINCNLNSSNPIKINFPVIKVIKLKNSIMDTSYLFKYIIGETNSLIKIHIEKINLTDNDLKCFFESLSKKKSILNSLKSLSFKGNILTKISFDNFITNETVLQNLQYLNFSKNNIYEFSEKIFRLLPELKIIDLTDNNFSNRILFDVIKEGKKIFKFIALLSNNIFIHNNKTNNNQYIKYISENLSSFQHKIKKISFSLLFNRDNLDYFTKLKISPAIKISLYKLDLSFCGLNEEYFKKFMKNNFGLLNLGVLNLSNNYFTDNIFDLCSGLKGDILLEKINVIDLSFNDINIREMNDLKTLDKFVENHHELKRIKLQNTNFLEGLKNLIKDINNKDEINNFIQKLTSRNIKFVLETGLDNLFTELYSNILSYKDKIY